MRQCLCGGVIPVLPSGVVAATGIVAGCKGETRPAMNQCSTQVTWCMDWPKNSMHGEGLITPWGNYRPTGNQL